MKCSHKFVFQRIKDDCNKSSNHFKMFDNFDGEYLKITYLEEEEKKYLKIFT